MVIKVRQTLKILKNVLGEVIRHNSKCIRKKYNMPVPKGE